MPNKPYLLCDGIYPKNLLLLHSVSDPWIEKKSYFAARQEGHQKDMEHSFGVHYAKFYIVTRLSRLCNADRMDTLMGFCVIIHNMIESELRPLYCDIPNASGRFNVWEDTEFCFEWLGKSTGVEPGKVSAICGVSGYLSDAYKYMRTSCLVFEQLIANMQVYLIYFFFA